MNGTLQTFEGFTDDVTTGQACDWIASAPDRPSLTILGYKSCHSPFEPAPRAAHLYNDVQIPKPPTFDKPAPDQPAWIQSSTTRGTHPTLAFPMTSCTSVRSPGIGRRRQPWRPAEATRVDRPARRYGRHLHERQRLPLARARALRQTRDVRREHPHPVAGSLSAARPARPQNRRDDAQRRSGADAARADRPARRGGDAGIECAQRASRFPRAQTERVLLSGPSRDAVLDAVTHGRVRPIGSWSITRRKGRHTSCTGCQRIPTKPRTFFSTQPTPRGGRVWSAS